MRSSWTDDRLDDLKDQVGELARRTDDGFRELREEMRVQRVEIDARLDAIQRTMVMFGVAMFAAMLGLVATQLGLILTRL